MTNNQCRGAADNAKKNFYETGAFGFYHVLCGEPGRCTALTFLRPFGSKRAELERGFPPSRLTTSSLLTLGNAHASTALLSLTRRGKPAVVNEPMEQREEKV